MKYLDYSRFLIPVAFFKFKQISDNDHVLKSFISSTEARVQMTLMDLDYGSSGFAQTFVFRASVSAFCHWDKSKTKY